MPDETPKPASASASAEDDETQERSQEPDLGTVARERSLFGEAWEANVKRSYDEYQDMSLKIARDMHVLTVQAMANLIANCQLATSNAIRHADQQASSHIQQTQITATQVAK